MTDPIIAENPACETSLSRVASPYCWGFDPAADNGEETLVALYLDAASMPAPWVALYYRTFPFPPEDDEQQQRSTVEINR